uniref:Uncharacterized protein n=2 Tax=Avena sativa TaxID=4498 RepID=A0ACD5Z357_AVESA
MPPWARADLRPDEAAVRCVGTRHRRQAPASRSAGVRSEGGPGVNGAVLRVAGDDHFQVVIVVLINNYNTQHGQRALACVYSSETGLWGDLISTPIPFEPDSVVCAIRDPAVLVGDSLYWKLSGFSTSILEFDFEKQSLAVIWVPVDESEYENDFKVIRADGGGLGFLFVSDFNAQLWERNINCDGVASWVLGRTIELDKLLSLDSEVEDDIVILGFAEENNMVLLWTESGSFMVQLQSLQFKKLSGFNSTTDYIPYESVYTAEIGGEHDGADLFHNA